jgi:hypothetical protein
MAVVPLAVVPEQWLLLLLQNVAKCSCAMVVALLADVL